MPIRLLKEKFLMANMLQFKLILNKINHKLMYNNNYNSLRTIKRFYTALLL